MLRSILNFLKRTDAQDLAEYCLITAFVALVIAGIIWNVTGGVSNLWDNSNNSLASATSATAPSSGGSGQSGQGGGQQGAVIH